MTSLDAEKDSKLTIIIIVIIIISVYSFDLYQDTTCIEGETSCSGKYASLLEMMIEA